MNWLDFAILFDCYIVLKKRFYEYLIELLSKIINLNLKLIYINIHSSIENTLNGSIFKRTGFKGIYIYKMIFSLINKLLLIYEILLKLLNFWSKIEPI